MSNIPLNDGVVKKGLLPVILLLLISSSAFAQEEAVEIRAITGTELLLYMLLGVLFFIAVMVIILLVNAIGILNQVSKTKGQPESKAVFSSDWWKKFVGAGVSLKDEKEILIEGHDYDGIQELDNRMPPWLQSLFLASIAIAIFYSV